MNRSRSSHYNVRNSAVAKKEAPKLSRLLLRSQGLHHPDKSEKTRALSLASCFFLCFVTGASRKHSPGCIIVGKLSDCPKDEETVDPESHPPFDCSIKRGGTIKENTTWKQVQSEVRHKECLVLKTANSEKRIYLASTLLLFL